MQVEQASGRVSGARVQHGEWRAVALSFLCFFCVLAAYYVIRPVREQLSAQVGSTQLPWFYAATFITTLVLTPIFAALASRWPRRKVVPLVYLFFIVCQLAFIPAFTHLGLLNPRLLGIVFFVWVSVFNLFVVSVFWIFMSDIWSLDQSKRLFPIIAVAGTLGALAGPALTRSLVNVIDVAPLLAVSAALLAGALICVVMLGNWARVHGARRYEVGHEDAIGGSMWDGLKQVLTDPFMRGMAILLLLADGIGTVNYALMVDYSGTTFVDAIARTRFHADVDLAGNLLTVIVQLGLTRWLLPRKGPGALIILWASISMAVLLMVAFSHHPHAPLFTLPVLIGPIAPTVLALVVSRGLAYGMAEPARHSLYTRVPRSVRYKGQNAVDTAVWRFGDVAIATGMDGLKSLGMAVGGFAALSAVAAFGAAGIGWRLWKRVDDSVTKSTLESPR